MLKQISQLWYYIEPPRRAQLGLIIILLLFTAIAEILSIGSILPFLGALTNPSLIFESEVGKKLILIMGISDRNGVLLLLTLVFIGLVLITGMLRLALLLANSRLSCSIGSDISRDIYRNTLYKPFSFHLNQNSSEIINAISVKSYSIIFGVILPILLLINSIVLLTSIFVAMLIITPSSALISFILLGMFYWIFGLIIKNKLKEDSIRVARESTYIIKAIQEGLGGIRDIILDGTQEKYCEIYSRADKPLRQAQARNAFLNQSPRFVMEALSMSVIAGIAYIMNQNSRGVEEVVPILGAIALGAQRCLPILQQAYSSWASIKGNQASLGDVLTLLQKPYEMSLTRVENLELFKSEILLNDINFSYDQSENLTLKNINLVIKKGERVGIIGVTGGGKSTLLDVIMGLLIPSNGAIYIDGIKITSESLNMWQSCIAHVPQVIYLADATIAENIAFGCDSNKINYDKLKEVIALAKLEDVIEKLPEKYNTLIGERGIRLSGGQRQRIGIARALYKDSKVLILDEATNALDDKTENQIIENIEKLTNATTIIMVAHRISTLKSCSKIIKVEAGFAHYTKI